MPPSGCETMLRHGGYFIIFLNNIYYYFFKIKYDYQNFWGQYFKFDIYLKNLDHLSLTAPHLTEHLYVSNVSYLR